MKKKALRPFPKLPGGRLPESAAPRWRRDGTLMRHSVRCGICGRNRAKCGYYHIFGGRLHVGVCWPCMNCLPVSDTNEFIEERLLERFAEMFRGAVAVQIKKEEK
jgi:hypothetical protein